MKVLFYGNAQEKALGEKSADFGDVQSVGVLIDQLGERFGGDLKDYLLGENTCLLLVNGSGIATTGGLKTPISADDKIEILPFVQGG